MRVSFDWLKRYIKIDENVKDIAKLLTFSGIEVENVINYGDFPEDVITAKVVESQLMKGSNHLMVCQVDTGKGIIQVVCGAPNCTNGIDVVLALPGAKLNGLEIKSTQIRGIESSGMICSEKELGLSDEHGGIMILPSDTLPGIPIKQFFDLPDKIYELEITPNRPDLLGYLGVAADLAACSDSDLVMPEINDNNTIVLDKETTDNYLSLAVKEPKLCTRYTARVIRKVKVGESPLWLKQRLIRSGLRPINNIVDITNYVMLEIGHPLHAFDYDKLAKVNDNPIIIVRRAKEHEQFHALDGKIYSLDKTNLVIADAEKPIALAGIIGGINSHITETTTNIVLESACFNHTSIRRTAHQHKISTDSSYRFERQMSPETTDFASIRASHLIAEITGGLLSFESLDEWANPEPLKIVPIRPLRFQQVIGLNLTKEQIVNYLVKLGLIYLGIGRNEWKELNAKELIPKLVKCNDKSEYFETNLFKRPLIHENDQVQEALYFEIPSKRVDLTREIDLIEEVIRLHGMDKVPQRTSVSVIMDRYSFKQKRLSADYLSQNGFNEIVNLSFTDPQLIKYLNLNDGDNRLNQIELLNPQNSNLSVMRTSLIPQLLQNAIYNIYHGSNRLMLFELSKIFLENSSLPKQERCRISFICSGLRHSNHWKDKSVHFDFFDIKGFVEGLLLLLGLNKYSYSTSVSGYLLNSESQSIVVNKYHIAEYGLLKPAIAARFNIDTVDLKQDVWIADVDLDKLIDLTRDIQLIYKPTPIFPSIERDLSFKIKSDISQDIIAESLMSSSGFSIHQLCLLDEYKGKQIPEGYRSLTYRLVFNNPEKTLTDDEVDTLIHNIVKNLKSQWDIQLR